MKTSSVVADSKRSETLSDSSRFRLCIHPLFDMLHSARLRHIVALSKQQDCQWEGRASTLDGEPYHSADALIINGRSWRHLFFTVQVLFARNLELISLGEKPCNGGEALVESCQCNMRLVQVQRLSSVQVTRHIFSVCITGTHLHSGRFSRGIGSERERERDVI